MFKHALLPNKQRPFAKKPGTSSCFCVLVVENIRKWDAEAECLIETSRNLPWWSQMPCKLKPCFFLLPQKNLIWGHLAVSHWIFVGFSVHTNMPSTAPTQQPKLAQLFLLNPAAIALCVSWSVGNSIARALHLSTASRTWSTLLHTSECDIPWTSAMSSPAPPAKNCKAQVSLKVLLINPLGAPLQCCFFDVDGLHTLHPRHGWRMRWSDQNECFSILCGRHRQCGPSSLNVEVISWRWWGQKHPVFGLSSLVVKKSSGLWQWGTLGAMKSSDALLPTVCHSQRKQARAKKETRSNEGVATTSWPQFVGSMTVSWGSLLLVLFGCCLWEMHLVGARAICCAMANATQKLFQQKDPKDCVESRWSEVWNFGLIFFWSGKAAKTN